MTDAAALVSGDLLDAAASLLSRGDCAQAMEMAEAALADGTARADAIYVLAAVAFRSQRLATAIRLLESVLDENAHKSDIPEVLAILNAMAGVSASALYYAKLTTIIAAEGRLAPLFGEGLPPLSVAFSVVPTKPLLALGRARLAEGALDEGVAQLEQHLELFPNDVEALDAYSDALVTAGRPREAIGVLRSVLTLGGPSATLYCRLGVCLTEVGAHDQARACHAEALARAPKALPLLTQILLDLDRHGDAAQSLRSAVADAFAAAIAATAPKTVRKAPPVTEKEKICIGYLCRSVSGAQRAMVAHVALAHDRATVTTVGFGNGDLSHQSNAAFRGNFDRWVDVAPLDELTLSVIARGEGIDVLIDADGLLTATRPHLFARNAAPLQLTWLNMPAGIALAGTHGSLADASVPMGSLLLPRAQESVAARKAETIAFAADVSVAQLTPEVARAWSAILHAQPKATMALFDRDLHAPENTSRLIELFGNFGVAHRIDVVANPSVEQFFAECDIALAPFPAPDSESYGLALSLGLPVITLDAGPGRLLANALRHSGFAADRMVAADVADYVAKACAWAGDPAGLLAARQEAPAIAAISPAFDAGAFAAGLERYVREHLASIKAG